MTTTAQNGIFSGKASLDAVDSESKKAKILLVDNDEIIRIYFHDIFWIYGFENRCELALASSLDDADSIMADPGSRPDIIFLGLTIPKKLGSRTVIDPKYSFNFLEHIKNTKELSHIKVIIFSGHDEDEFRAEAKRLHADGYLHKKESLPKDLVAAINEALDGIKKS